MDCSAEPGHAPREFFDLSATAFQWRRLPRYLAWRRSLPCLDKLRASLDRLAALAEGSGRSG